MKVVVVASNTAWVPAAVSVPEPESRRIEAASEALPE